MNYDNNKNDNSSKSAKIITTRSKEKSSYTSGKNYFFFARLFLKKYLIFPNVFCSVFCIMLFALDYCHSKIIDKNFISNTNFRAKINKIS